MSELTAEPPPITVLMLTVSIVTLRRQMVHNSYVNGPMTANGSFHDYIIVGGGSAGCTLAGRLADNPNVSVLLLEAGGPQLVVTDMPGNVYEYLQGTDFDWNYHVQPQLTSGQAYPTFYYPRGKILGGSSTLTWSLFNRGNPLDYDNWATQYGLKDFSWPNVLEYFLRFENNTDASIRSNGLHSTTGPVAISSEPSPDQVMLNFRSLMNKAGLPTIDINGPSQLGTAVFQMFVNNYTAIKSTTANAYIESKNRTNLSISSRSFVTRVLTSMNGTRALGVQYRNKNGTTMVAYANREVIISAGAINTPQVLMLSGIGPRDHLNDFGIPVVRDLPVGDNLHDMPSAAIYYKIVNESETVPFPAMTIPNLYDYYQNAAGPLAHQPNVIAYYVSRNNPNKTWPDTMLVSTVEFNINRTIGQYQVNTDAWRAYWEPMQKYGHYEAVYTVLARPRSRGTVRLNATDPTGNPLVDPRYLADDADFEAMLDVTRFAVHSIRTHGLQGTRPFPPIPGCPSCDFCDAYLRCHLRMMSRNCNHFVGSARMGLTGDVNAVVDPNFRVMGFSNLRVVDASVMPEVPNGHTNAATIMLAEKAAQLINSGQ